ncbi:PPE domain-containing protein [Actinokineospora spheciospongiae]|uniref:PPE domain-containing protein n=1 Tax=Actinokineospora spheciospongiae TaxID=909613 RepID=UPI000D7162DF|nr:PPE domain-containing protein [Actinokineospora spheciospongiae]PWW50887.1 PPE family protein [Actinokineospora spheciospongiae]
MAMHRWEGYDHPTLFKMINSGPGPAASTAQTEYWSALTAELEQIDADLATKLSTMQATWEGGAADQAQTGLTPLQAWAADAQSGASLMRASTEYQADIVGRARAEMPEPVQVTTPAPSGWDKLAAGAALLTGNAGPAAGVLAQSQDHEAQEAAQDAASQKAVDTMDSYQSSTNFNTSTLGTFVPPPDVVISTPAPDGGVGHQVGYAISQATGGTGGSNGGTSAASYTPVQLTSGTPGQYLAPTGGASPVHTPQFVPGGNPPAFTPVSASTTPAGYVPPTGGGTHTPITPNGLTGVPTGGGGLPSGDATRFPGGIRPGLTPTDAGLARGGPVAGQAAAQEAAARRGALAGGLGGSAPAEGPARGGANSALGRGGVAGAGSFSGDSLLGGRNGTAGAAGGKAGTGAGAMGGGRGANADEEEDFEHASYLVETDDIFGDERHVAPGVLGSDR